MHLEAGMAQAMNDKRAAKWLSRTRAELIWFGVHHNIRELLNK
jgi:hypothetical protein